MDGERRPRPDPDHGGALHPPRRPTGCHAEGPTPSEKVWGRLGLQEMPTPASTEHSRMFLREAPSPPRGGGVKGGRGRTALADTCTRGTCLGRTTRMPQVTTPAPQTTDKTATGVKIQISAEGYSDNTYMLAIHLLLLLTMLVATSKWPKLTGQEVNAKQLLAFSATNRLRRKPEPLEVTLDGVRMPAQQEFRRLGVGVRTMPRRGTGPLLQRRIGEAKKALKKTRTIPGCFDRKATVAAVMIIAAALFRVELADISWRDTSNLESAIMGAIWGPSRPYRTKEIVFAVLLPGHRVAPSVVIPYRRMCWLAHLVRNPGTARTVAQAIWEGMQSPKPTGPLGRALQEFRWLGWCNMRGWWQWSLPYSATVVHLVHAPKEYVEHLFREALRESQLWRWRNGGRAPSGAWGPGWIADRAHRRGLRPDGGCPYCPREVREDEDHLLWRCTAWNTVRDSTCTTGAQHRTLKERPILSGYRWQF